MDLERIRREAPGAAERIHLNNAGASLMPEPVLRTAVDYLKLESRVGGYEAADLSRGAIAGAYEAVADLLGTDAAHIAFTANATASFAQVLSAIPFEAEDVILTTRHDYSSNQIQFLSLQKRFGIRLLRAPDHPDGGVDVEAMARQIRSLRPRLVSVSHIPTNSGMVQDVEAIGQVCREEEILYLVDACQSIGQMPVHPEVLGCDFLTATSRKFLRGPRGCGFLWVSEGVLKSGLEPLFIDLHGAHWLEADTYEAVADAKRFENWEFSWALVLATGEAARYAQNLGLQEIQDRAWALADRLRRGLGEIPGLRVLDRGRELAAIVTVWISGRRPADLVRALRSKSLNTSAQTRESAILDFDFKGTDGALRLSPHYFNTEEEIDRAVELVGEEVAAEHRS